MPEDIVIRRRNRLKKHFVNTSNVLLYGYKELSDGAKLTYQVIDSFDWEDGETGTSKGYSFPSLKTIAKARGKSWTTIWRHIEELIEVDLITKHSRAKEGKPSILIIEEVSEEEQRKYLEEFVDRKPRDEGVLQKRNGEVLQERKPKEDEDHKEDENFVNGTESVSERKATGPTPIGEILNTAIKQSGRAMDRHTAKREYLAAEMVKVLGDQESLGCYRRIAERCPEDLVFEALAIVKETDRLGEIRVSKGALFVSLMKEFAETRGIDLELASRRPTSAPK